MEPQYSNTGALLQTPQPHSSSNVLPPGSSSGNPASGAPGSNLIPNHMILLQNFWQSQLAAIEGGELDFKNFQLPLARIKKVMKTDEEVKMISAEAPIIFAKACEIFILELTLRAWIHTEECKRRTLQRSDVAAAISKTDTFDFLIDIVPREESRPVPKKFDSYRAAFGDPNAFFFPGNTPGLPSMAGPPYGTDQMMYYQQQQHQQQHQQYSQMMRQQQMMQGNMDSQLNTPPVMNVSGSGSNVPPGANMVVPNGVIH